MLGAEVGREGGKGKVAGPVRAWVSIFDWGLFVYVCIQATEWLWLVR